MKGWTFPYPCRDNPRKGLLQLLQFVDYLAYSLNKPPGTVKQYYSGAKMYQLKSLSFAVSGLTEAGPWYPEGSNHSLIKLALANVPEQDTVEGFAIPADWMEEGFYEWPMHDYVSMEIIFGWLGRSGEFLNTKANHQGRWGMVTFLRFVISSEETRPMTKEEILCEPCDMVQLKLVTRKQQKKGKVRPQPGRINHQRLAEPAEGLDAYRHGCVATLMQAWFIVTGAVHLSAAELEIRPIVADAKGKVCTRERLVKLLRSKAVVKGIDPQSVRMHGLRIGPISNMVNNFPEMSGSVQTAISGHKTVDNMTPYIRADVGMAEAATRVMMRDKAK
jgi:hypothetical protein